MANRKIENISWFYPLFTLAMIAGILVGLIMVGAGLLSILVPVVLLAVSEVPVVRYKMGKTTRAVAEFDWLVIYLIGVASAVLVFLSYSPKQLFVVGLVVGILTYIKMTALTSYNRLDE